MTVIELAQILAAKIAQGGGQFEVSVFQWQHGWEPLTGVEVREGCRLIELYSGTGQACEDDDLLGLGQPVPQDDDFDDLI